MGYEEINEQKECGAEKKNKKFIFLWIILLLLAVGAILFLTAYKMGCFYKTAKIRLEISDVEILQGEELPVMKAEVKTETEYDEKVVLDKKKKYKAKDLIKELQEGKNYVIETNADPAVEGSYKLQIKLDKALKKKLDGEWKESVKLEVGEAEVFVKNPVGEWEGSKFKRYDGTYITEDFVISMGKSYYFDKDGNKVSGLQVIGENTYCFDETGIMLTGWQQQDKNRYYFSENGIAVTGWQTVDEDNYYFEEDGKMATGEVEIGLALCTFDKEGKMVSKALTNVDASKPMVALTFDDGPGERTGELLAQLELYNARATFFMLGQKVASNADLVKKMAELKCELGNHSYSHKDLSKQDASVVSAEVDGTNNQLLEAAGQSATVMRPPYGAIGGVMKEQIQMPLILWNIDTLDWKTRNAQATIDSVMNNVKDGDVILMHDIHSESVDAAIQLIPMLQEAGYQLVTVSELVAAKGVTLANGGKYTDF